MLLPLKKSNNQEVVYTPKGSNPIKLWIKREDLLHPHISGNKYRKLRYNLEAAQDKGCSTLITFGGAYSNHIAATAAAGKEFGFKTIGVIRGDELVNIMKSKENINPTLSFAHKQGMQFKFIDRKSYRQKHTTEFKEKLKKEFGDFYLVPEGGTNVLAVEGCEEILNKEDAKFDYICCAIGTGGTISGIINSLNNHQKVLGFPALKGDFLSDVIKQYVRPTDNWHLKTDYNFGGFAKINEELVHFINDFKKQTTLQLDPIYTGKMLYGIVDLHTKGYFEEDTKILAIHSGGLQGIDGMNQRLKNKNLPTIIT